MFGVWKRTGAGQTQSLRHGIVYIAIKYLFKLRSKSRHTQMILTYCA